MSGAMTRRVAAAMGGRGVLPFGDDFDRGDGALGGKWTGATWTVDTNQAKNTPTAGGERLENYDFALWTGDDPNNWSVTNEDVNNYITEDAGTANLVSDNSAAIQMVNGESAVTGNWLYHAIEATVNSGKWRVIISHTAAPSSVNFVGSDTGTVVLTTRQGDVASNFQIVRDASGASNINYDNASQKPLTLSTLFASRETSQANIVVDIDVTLANIALNLTQAGVICRLDDAATPANFIIGYHDGTNANLDKCVAGTYTSLIATSAAYGAGNTLQVKTSGSSVELWYNGNKIGATQTVSDAGILNNTIHGLFSTNSGNRLDNFQAVNN